MCHSRNCISACFSALRGTTVQLARAEKHKSADFCALSRAVKELTSDFSKLVLSGTRLLQHLFPLNAHISPVCTRFSAENRHIRTKYEHFTSNGKYIPDMGRMGENCSYFFAERRFGETDAMGRNTGNYHLSDFCPCLLKPKKPKFEQDTVRRLKPSQSP